SLSGLKGNTTYYVRAYATNNAGTGYGSQVSFKTPVDLPAVTTAEVINVTKTGAISGGEVTYDGGGDVTARGLVWSMNENPTTDDNVIDGGSGTGVFISTLDGLELSTTYHVRAYATNSAGTAYGDDLSFTTLADITKFWVVGDYNGWDNSDNAQYIQSTATSNGLAEGYVYLKQGGIKLVTDHSWDNAYTFGDDGSGGLTNPGDNISVPEDGYYRIQANLSDMTYSLLKTDWGVIGDATPSGWDDETPLTYDANTNTWNGGIHLTAAAVKFRANHSWDYNYGSDNADGTLQAGGANIAIDMEDDYAITLDLGHPNEYTYSINRWGLIGDATPDGWNSDQNMTWDATSQVFTITLDLTAGAIKFRANDAWDVNYGGDLNALTPGGDNISIGTAGNYTITFDPWGLKATVTMN
ncbi:MAG TPA: SusF/SusE family outer membrane protein, partial [Sunxiuqinia sp.]|nr:SusF/SusE family outer membrane protein [Sunxiuqinia sp.]